MNYINQVKKLKKQWHTGMPDGLDESFFKDAEYLFLRIDELERALVPFSYTYHREKQFGDKLVKVNITDCERASAVLDQQNSYPTSTGKVEYPA